ncbi:hypothetical protein KP509_11G003800 [Ceratopteris richardii]|uniref:Uncharacterized protein n=1 Tax=Ceratopteris richardii TaxID=49495 RepID=A0A8T2TV12_CERRI|nr:hypothetical protein KP509_11G003800 [Ceratopteris richardii]
MPSSFGNLRSLQRMCLSNIPSPRGSIPDCFREFSCWNELNGPSTAHSPPLCPESHGVLVPSLQLPSLMRIALQPGVGHPDHPRASRFYYGLGRLLQQRWTTQNGSNISIFNGAEQCAVYSSQIAASRVSLP